MTKTTVHLFMVVGLSLMLVVSGCTDFQAGVGAYKRGDYETALKELRPLADYGDARAQTKLGYMYLEGLGVPQHYQEALRWYRLSADQGDAVAQYNLGLMYGKGQGVAQDYVLAHMWVTLAWLRGREDALKVRGILEGLMIPTQLAQAQRLAREWVLKEE